MKMINMRRAITLVFFLASFLDGKCQILDTLIDVGGIKLHFTIKKGKGIPILFESGNGDDGTVWNDIITPLYNATGATLITYDRAGLGLSEIDTAKVNLLSEVKWLEIGLEKLGYDQNIFLVSHSFGSYYSTLFTKRNSKKVKGIVFIDVLTPCYLTKKRARDTKESITEADWKMLKKEAVGLYYVLQNLENIYEFTKDSSLPTKIPATIIAAENPPQIVKENEKNEWINCLKALGELPNHSFVFATKCGHKVWKDNLELVTSEIAKLYKKIASNQEK
jgi:predicted alpha/beta hydrolase family esterase